jgi:predicted O-methyltransferase YrrM
MSTLPPVTCACRRPDCPACAPVLAHVAARLERVRAGHRASDSTVVFSDGSEPPAVPHGWPVPQVGYCRLTEVYTWVLRVGGRVVESGRERGERAAWDAAFAAAREVAEGPPPTVVIDGGGIGDALCALAVARGLGPDVRVDVPPDRRAWVELFAPHVGTALPIRLHDYKPGDQLPRWERWARTFGATCRLPDPPELPADALDWARPLAGRVALSPFAAYSERTWPAARWQEVERQLVERGLDTVVLDDADPRHGRRAEAFRGHVLRGESPARVAAVLSYAAAFAGNDSGMAHLAGCLCVPGVCVSSAASDNRIMGLYPTIREVGGRARGFDRVGPDEVVAAVLDKVREAAGDFPADQFAAVLADRDRWRLEGWLPIYAALWRTVRELAPKRIVEIGTRAGYSAWTILRACPDATVEGFDLDCDEHGGFKGAHEHARAVLPADRFRLTIADSHTLERLPECDVVYVDGDHSREGALQDLRLGLTAKPRALILDDATNLDDVRRAGDEFARERGLTPRFVPSRTGLYVFGLPGG